MASCVTNLVVTCMRVSVVQHVCGAWSSHPGSSVTPLLEGASELQQEQVIQRSTQKCLAQSVLSTFSLFICLSPLLLQGDQLHVAN